MNKAGKDYEHWSQVAEEWLASEKDLAYSTRLSYRRALDGYWLPKLGEEKISEILPSDVKLVVADLAAKNRNNVLIPCRRAFAFAVDDQIIDRSPCETIRNSKVQKDPPDPFDLGEVEIHDLSPRRLGVVVDDPRGDPRAGDLRQQVRRSIERLPRQRGGNPLLVPQARL